MSRVFEKMLTNSITSFLLKNSLLSPLQFGCISVKSVRLQLLSCLKTWNQLLMITNVLILFILTLKRLSIK